MSETGYIWIGAALLLLATFPLLLYGFFSLVVLERKSQGLIDELKSVKAFDIPTLKARLHDEHAVRTTMQSRYGYKRFLWPVGLLTLSNLIGFGIVWDIMYFHFFSSTVPAQGWAYPTAFLTKADFPMTAFLAVVMLNYTTMLRRLYVWDITTQVFWNALQRTWTAVIVASVLAASAEFLAPQGGSSGSRPVTAHILYFGIGLITNEVIRWILDRTRDRLQIRKSKVEELPLSLIQGINFWHEIRLEEEGVENVQNLATCDLIDLSIATRFNLRTLLDWVDQAILVHRIGQKACVLRDDGFISGAIDMAWAAPQNAQGDARLAEQIARTVKAEPIYVATLMNSLFQDTQVRVLWDMWQSEPDARSSGMNPVQETS